MAKRDLPYMQFYVADWMGDEQVQSCSLAARGLWMQMLCLMWRSGDRGLLVINGSAPTTRQLARLVSEAEDVVVECIAELRDNGVFSEHEGIIVSRRMRTEELERQRVRAAVAKSKAKKQESNYESNGEVTPQSSESQRSESQKREPPLPPAGGKSPPVKSDDVDRVYAAYPRKVGPAQAKTAIKSALKTLHARGDPPGGAASWADWLAARVKRYAAERAKAVAAKPGDAQFTPHPSTWFRGGRYDDDPDPPPDDGPDESGVYGPNSPRVVPDLTKLFPAPGVTQ